MKRTSASEFDAWLNEHMKQGKRYVPARLLTLLGLLERLRDAPTLHLDSHKAGSGMQLIDHNAFVVRALNRLGVKSPLEEFGRRSSNLHAWANPLFTWLRAAGFREGEMAQNDQLLTWAESKVAALLTLINEDKPLIARYNKGTAVAVIADILDQAQAKNRAKDVAEYLVGAKLQMKFSEDVIKPKNVNTPSLGQLADFRVGKTAIEVTTVERPDKGHLDQLEGILRDTGLHVWLLTRMRDRERWQNAVEAFVGAQASRVVVADIETFVGQNVSEIGKFEPVETRSTLEALFKRYTEQWLPSAGSGGLRIVNPEAGEL